jgi:2-polyprenyl-3-methyl-5-hydroxy-6-metoxy-1,4-benzoquinol methylase
LSGLFDFVTATEVVEHLQAPGHWLELLWSRIKPGGILAIQTKRVIDRPRFSQWHYRLDPTHIMFFSEETFVWLAKHWQADLELVADDVVMIQKNA